MRETKNENTETIEFPINNELEWHLGHHIFYPVAQWRVALFGVYRNIYLGKVISARKKGEIFYPTLKSELLEEDFNKLKDLGLIGDNTVQEKIGQVVKLKLLSEEMNNLITANLELSSSINYILQEHSVNFEENKIEYYTLLMHFKDLEFYKRREDYIIYLDELQEKQPPYIFPHDPIGTYGFSEGKENMLHSEIFMASEFPKIKDFIKCLDYKWLKAGTNVYSPNLQQSQGKQTYPFYTVCKMNKIENNNTLVELEVIETPVHIDGDELERNDLRFEYYENRDKDGNLIKIGHTLKKITTEETIDEDIEISVLLGSEKKKIKKSCLKTVYKYEDILLVDRNLLNIPNIYAYINNENLKETSKKNVILYGKGTGVDVVIETYDEPYECISMSKTARTVQNDRMVFESEWNNIYGYYTKNNDDFYFQIPGIGFIKFTDLTLADGENALKDLCSVPIIRNLYIERKKGKTAKEMLIDSLQNQCEAYSKSEDKDITHFGYEHASEWKQWNKEQWNIYVYASERIQLDKTISIWNEKGKNKKLDKKIKNCNKFIYFYEPYFSLKIRNIHRGYAQKLLLVQEEVMHKFSYKQGNCGLYPNNYSVVGRADNKQTFCNHAVYETIKQVDGEYLKFLMDVDEPAWALAKYTSKKEGKDFLSFLNKRKNLEDGNYKYKPSNLWCDVLKYQASKSSETGIYKIKAKNAEQAFYMAQLGYVVIAAWKNTSNNGSPHFVTVRPCEGEYPGLESLLVAHVGSVYTDEDKNIHCNEIRKISRAFVKNSFDDIEFYCNIKQTFI